MAGMKRTVARNHQLTGESASNTKGPLSLDGLKAICNILIKSGNPEYIFAPAFLTLEWSLMARADNCAISHMNHLEWHDNSLVIFFLHSKGDQKGMNRSEPWHIYSNPIFPCICPILALAKYLFTNPTLFKGNSRIFQEVTHIIDS